MPTSNLFKPLRFKKGQKVTLKMIDFSGGHVIEFDAKATGNTTVIPDTMTDGQFTRIKDIWVSEGCIMVLVLREGVR